MSVDVHGRLPAKGFGTAGAMVRDLAFRSPGFSAALVTIIIILLLSVVGTSMVHWDPYATNPSARLLPPSSTHFFGTDQLGRDTMSRVFAGGANTTLTAFGILAIAVTIGTFVGLLSGYLGGVVDEALMRVTDVFLAFPAMILAMCLAATLGPSIFNAMVATGLVWWPWYARLVRAETIRIKGELFVEAAVVMGASSPRILIVHILRNGYVPVLVQASMDVGYAVLTLASLSFIGLGAQPPAAEWGGMVSTGKDYFLNQWWLVVFPGAAIFIFVFCFNVVGEHLQLMLTRERQN